MIIAVLEWNNESDAAPIVIVADDLVGARRAALEQIARHLPDDDGDSEITDIDRD